MKSAHRHELQTNALAQRLEVAIERLRPYVSTIAGVIVAIAVVMLIWSYMSKSSATRQDDAWNAYNQAIGATMPNLEELHRSAQEYPGTKMQELADITWADGQVFEASRNYINNRAASNAAMGRAVSVYTGILGTSKDPSLIDRAHLGLARVYEMRGDLEKAGDEYRAIEGGYAAYAKEQADRLAEPEAKETYAWLAKAVPPRNQPPAGPGIPGQTPEFSASELTLPDATMEPAMPPATSFDDLLKGLGELPTEGLGAPKGEATPPVNPALPETPVTTPESKDDAPAAEPAPATENTSPPADAGAAPPPAEANSADEKSNE